jgi:transcriptional regulator with XRE-family HTH domain
MTTFGERARELMAAQGLNVRELARRSFYDKAHVSRVLNGQKVPGAELARRLDSVLGADGTLAELADDRLARAAQGQLRVDSTVLASVVEMLAATRRLEDVTSARHRAALGA